MVKKKQNDEYTPSKELKERIALLERELEYEKGNRNAVEAILKVREEKERKDKEEEKYKEEEKKRWRGCCSFKRPSECQDWMDKNPEKLITNVVEKLPSHPYEGSSIVIFWEKKNSLSR